MKIIDKEITSVDTPRVFVDYEILLGNIHLMHNFANKNNVKIRPHVKSHKSLDISRLQLKEGAMGFTAAKADEAAVFLNLPVSSITIAYPLIEKNKIQRVLSTSREYELEFNFIVDSSEGYELISSMCESMGISAGIFIKIDAGLMRCGLQPDNPDIVQIARKATVNNYIEFKGLLSHAGHAYKAKDVKEVENIALAELDLLSNVKNKLAESGIEVKEVSVGCTPTLLTGVNLAGVTEIRPGNYIFMDRLSWKLGLITPEQISLTVMATVISKNKNYFIIDAGSKVLSSDTGAHGSKILTGFGTAYPADEYLKDKKKMEIVALSEEHGFIKRPGYDLPVGSRIRIIPNHACTVVNLTDSLIVHKENKITESWRVHARGKVL